MTAAELTCEVLDRRNILAKDKEYWSCWEVSDKEEMGKKDGKTDGEDTVVDQNLTFFMLMQIMIFLFFLSCIHIYYVLFF